MTGGRSPAPTPWPDPDQPPEPWPGEDEPSTWEPDDQPAPLGDGAEIMCTEKASEVETTLMARA